MKIKSILLSGMVLSALAAVSANAQLFLNSFNFTNPTTSGGQMVTITLSGSQATYTTGTGGSAPLPRGTDIARFTRNGASGVNFVAETPISLGTMDFFNRNNNVGTTDPLANLNLTLAFVQGTIVLSPITFSIDNDTGSGFGGDNLFGAYSGLSGLVSISGDDYIYTLSGVGITPASLAPLQTGYTGRSVLITFTPIPEPSTYGIMGAVGLLGVVAYRRSRKAKQVA